MRLEVRRGKPGYDINLFGPDGPVRERRAFPEVVRTKSAQERYALARQIALAKGAGIDKEEPPAALFKDFAARWMKEYVKAEGLKPSTVDTYQRILRLHLTGLNGKRLDQIGPPEIQRLKFELVGKKLGEKSRHCVLAVLDEILGAAVDWKEIHEKPKIEKPRWQDREMQFYDFGEWERLLDGAARAGPMVLCSVLLMGDAGLRRGEAVALEQSDCRGGFVHVLRSEWQGHVRSPKGGQGRVVPTTRRLEQAIQVVRHLRGPRLLWQANGEPCKITTLQSWLEVACKRAGLPPSRNLHKLRHTFCSHLAMRGATAGAIQKLAGHADMTTTMRYMHLSPAHVESAIRLLETGPNLDRASK